MTKISGESNPGQPWIAWVPTWTGFSVDPTGVVARYILIGKTCHIYMIPSGSGTSNAGTITMTLPFAAANTGIQIGTNVVIINNGTSVAVNGRIDSRVNSNIADIYRDLIATAFTASGAKRASLTYTYEIA